MYQNSVSFKDYEGIQGFGIGSQSEVDELNKALSAGYQRPPASGGSALRVESLEATLRTVTFTLQNIKMWPKIPKLPAFSTVEEYNLLSDYGADAGAFTAEGDLPETQDATYQRKTALVKFLGTTREVTHPMTLVRPAHGNVVALETQNGAIWLVERLERALFNGRSDCNSYEFDGLAKQILDGAGVTNPWDNDPAAAGVPVIDLRGGALTEDSLETGTNVVVENYGTPTDLMIAPRANSELAKSFYPRERVNLPYPTDGKVGLAVNSFVSNAGLIGLNPDIFLRPGRNNGQKGVPTGPTSSKAPNAPSGVTVVLAPDAGVNKFGAADAGAYLYKFTAFNRYGESTAVALTGGAATIGVGVKGTFTITDGGFGAGAAVATGYKVYRSPVNGATGSELIMTSIPSSGGGTTTFVDHNYWIPGTSQAFLLQNNLNFYSFRQLAPMIKIPLATVAASIRWMQLLYGTPIVYAPKKGLIYINVKDA